MWLVAKGFHQTPGLDFHNIFSPVIKLATVRIVLTLVVTLNWPILQLDINNDFLNGVLAQPVYMQQPDGFVDLSWSGHVCLLHKAIYGFRQAPYAWYDKLR